MYKGECNKVIYSFAIETPIGKYKNIWLLGLVKKKSISPLKEEPS
jgi:hypothetical protein